MIDRATIQNFASQLQSSLGGNDYVIVNLGARGPNMDMPDGNMLATVRIGDDEATAEAKYLDDAVTLARGIILRKREAEAKKRKEKRDAQN
jgi:hypothetical protein